MATATKGKSKGKQKPKQEPEDPKHAPPAEAAIFLNVSVWSIYRGINSGEIKAVRVLGQKRIPWKVLREISPDA